MHSIFQHPEFTAAIGLSPIQFSIARVRGVDVAVYKDEEIMVRVSHAWRRHDRVGVNYNVEITSEIPSEIYDGGWAIYVPLTNFTVNICCESIIVFNLIKIVSKLKCVEGFQIDEMRYEQILKSYREEITAHQRIEWKREMLEARNG